jgi:hypothetical protein
VVLVVHMVALTCENGDGGNHSCHGLDFDDDLMSEFCFKKSPKPQYNGLLKNNHHLYHHLPRPHLPCLLPLLCFPLPLIVDIFWHHAARKIFTKCCIFIFEQSVGHTHMTKAETSSSLFNDASGVRT